MAKLLDDENKLYLTFVKSILQEVNTVNLAFEQTKADITLLYSDLRSMVFSLVGRVLKPSVIAEAGRPGWCKGTLYTFYCFTDSHKAFINPLFPGVLRVDKVEMLTQAFSRDENLIPTDRVNLGDSFQTLLATAVQLEASVVFKIRQHCVNFLTTLCKELLKRLPGNVRIITKLRLFVPKITLTRTSRPTFSQLPMELGGECFFFLSAAFTILLILLKSK